MTTAAGRSAGRPATSRDSASIPPAEEPMTMSWDPFSIRPPRVAANLTRGSRLARRRYCISPAAKRDMSFV